MKFKIYDTKNKHVKSALIFLATLMLSSFIPSIVVASDISSSNDHQDSLSVNLADLGFTNIYLDIPEYYLEYLEQDISFISEDEFLELQDDKVILEEIVLDGEHVFVLYEDENTNGHIGIRARIVFTKIAISTFVALKNPAVITRLKTVVASNTMRVMTDSRAGAIRSALRNQVFGSNQALQDTVMRRMVNSGMTPAQARAIGLGVSQLVRWR